MAVKRLLWLSSLMLLFAATAEAMLPPGHISHVAPNIGSPAGGEIVRIHGGGFTGPVRVLFETGGGVMRETFVVSLTQNQIAVITPPVKLISPSQQLTATIHVILNAGTASEAALRARDAFTFRHEILQPLIHIVAPAAGPVAGGTRVTLIGEGFQAPVMIQILGPRGAAEARIIDVQFNQILFEVPPAAALGAAPGEAVDVRVRNIGSESETIAEGAFRYLAPMVISEVLPAIGPASGNSTVTLRGSGFQTPVAVTIAGVPAIVLRVSGNEIVARTGAVTTSSCTDVRGTVQVLDINTGDLAEGPEFRYVMTGPVITGAPRQATAGQEVSLSLASSIQFAPITIALAGAPPMQAFVSEGKLTFRIPEMLPFPRAACLVNGVAGVEPRPLTAFVRVTDEFGCSNGVQMLVLPPEPVTCTAMPGAVDL